MLSVTQAPASIGQVIAIQFMAQYRWLRFPVSLTGLAVFSGTEVHDFHASRWRRSDLAERRSGPRNMPAEVPGAKQTLQVYAKRASDLGGQCACACRAVHGGGHHDSSQPDVRALHERLLSHGKAKMSTLCAAMRKLAHIRFGVFQETLDPIALRLVDSLD